LTQKGVLRVPEFQSFWFGDVVPVYQRLAMKSFLDHGHQYVLYAYKTLDVPAGVILRDASEILPESSVFFYGERAGVGRGSVAGFANLFRYHMLYRLGGWWVDADVICLSGSVPASDTFIGWEYANLIGNAILALPAGHALARDLRDTAEAAGSDVQWGATGPNLLTRLVRERGLLDLVQPRDFAYPVQSMDALHLLIPARRDAVNERISGKPFLHIWNEIQRRAVILPWMAPPPESALSDLFVRHGFDLTTYPTYTADQIARLSDNYYAAATWSHESAEKAEIARLKARLARLQDCESEMLKLRAELSALKSRYSAEG
jgi:hypothetical protein